MNQINDKYMNYIRTKRIIGNTMLDGWKLASQFDFKSAELSTRSCPNKRENDELIRIT